MRGQTGTCIVLYVKDLEREEAFYRDVIGLEVTFSEPDWLQFNANGASVILHTKPNNEESTSWSNGAHLGFQLVDLQAEYERLTSLQVEFKAPPVAAEFGRHATCLDPEGNEIDLLEWKRAPAPRVTEDTIVNDIIAKHPETMEVFEDHGIRICGGCLVLLNAPVYETAEYSGLDAKESTELVGELNEKLEGLMSEPLAIVQESTGARQ